MFYTHINEQKITIHCTITCHFIQFRLFSITHIYIKSENEPVLYQGSHFLYTLTPNSPVCCPRGDSSLTYCFLSQLTLTQWFANCGKCTSGGTWAPSSGTWEVQIVCVCGCVCLYVYIYMNRCNWHVIDILICCSKLQILVPTK